MKKQNKKKKHYNLTFDNLAIPEIHTGIQGNKENDDKENDEQSTGSVTFDTVAVPEVHVRKKN